MSEASQHTVQLQTLLDRLHAGDASAREALIGHASERLRRLTRKMCKDFARVKRWEETDDVLQNALLRLWHALQEVLPRSAREFYSLASLQIRRELLDLARHYSGPQGAGANRGSTAEGEGSESTPRSLGEQEDTTYEPSRLAVWSEFHQQVEALPQQEQEVFDLLWYQELTHGEAALLLGVSAATLKRRWLAARRRLAQALKGQLP